ncbi:hypothetical protein GGI19_002211 [Coemansia pectinata]|uniref:F-box domain-containing protein n=1 Tax=Coemansia pectinata TaxID=1052879 RepID=A0A9W8LCR5_9FUNG|nr:hypothetical protein GGI19_002211 [Coemansia pectinata]
MPTTNFSTTLPLASILPSECLLLVLGHLWDNDYDLATRFFERHSHRSIDYDQTRIYHTLRARPISPLHVCRSWRQCAMPRYFRFSVVDLISTDKPAKQLLPWTLRFVDRLFLCVAPAADDGYQNHTDRAITNAQKLAHILPQALSHARVIGLCVIDSQSTRAHVWQQQQQQQQSTTLALGSDLTGQNCDRHASSPIEELSDLLSSRMPKLERIWFQSSNWVSAQACTLVRTLTSPLDNCRPACRITAIHLAASNRRNADVIDIIHQSAQSLEFLSLGHISGGILGDITHTANIIPHQRQTAGRSENNDDNGHAPALPKRQVTYPALKRLLFAVDANAHIFANLPNYRVCPFPNLVDLHFDDSLSNGLPREEWYAPLYDVFLKHSGMKLRRLTFPVVYNTQRTVSARNCPLLVDLRHIKCCWATGPWGTVQNESDSTRLLRATTSISTLRRYIHPSYIARLSDMPANISCLSLSHLDLYGWPLTLRNLAWVLRTFNSLTTLKVTLTRAIEWDNERAHRGPHFDDSAPSVGGYLDHEFSDNVWSPVQQLTIGAADYGLALWERLYLLDLLRQLKRLSMVSLYSGAYAYVKTENEKCKVSLKSGCYSTRPIKARITNLDSVGLSSQPIAEPVASPPLNTAASLSPSITTRLVSRAQATTTVSTLSNPNNSWHLIHRLLVGE